MFPVMLPESGERIAFKYAIMEYVAGWTLACGCKIVAKPEWVEYIYDGIGPEQLVCPYCKQVDPKFIYVTGAGMALINSRGVKASDVRAYVGSFESWVFPAIRRMMADMGNIFDILTEGTQRLP